MRVETLRWISSDTCWRDSWLEQICSLNNSVKKTLLRQITLVQFWASALQQYKLLPGMIRDTLDLCSPSQTTPSATLFKHRVKKVWRVNIFAGIADIYWKLSHLCWEKKWSCQPAVQAPPGDFLPLKTQHQLKPLGFSPSPCFVDTTSYIQFVSVTSWSGVNRSSRIVLLSSILWKKRVTSEPVCLSSTQQLFVLLLWVDRHVYTPTLRAKKDHWQFKYHSDLWRSCPKALRNVQIPVGTLPYFRLRWRTKSQQNEANSVIRLWQNYIYFILLKPVITGS